MSTETPFVIFSTSKAITAMVAHLLDLAARQSISGTGSASTCPEFAAHGKEHVTSPTSSRTGRACRTSPSPSLDLDNIEDHDLVVRTMCEQKPLSRPGKALAYHAISGGFIVDEIVRRVTGKDIRTVLREEILEPLGFRFCNFGVSPRTSRSSVTRLRDGRAHLAADLDPPRARAGPAPGQDPGTSNDPRFLTGIIPAGNVVASANELSRFFELLRAAARWTASRSTSPARSAGRSASSPTARSTSRSGSRPVTARVHARRPVAEHLRAGHQHVFGHLGYTNTIGWADPERATSCAIVTSGKPMIYPELPDFWGVMRRIGQECPKADRANDPLAIPGVG